jgi:hypothetical protein
MLDAIEQVAESANMSITSNVLRRYMRDLYGTREEPWRELERAMIPMIEDSDIELVEESAPRALAGLPMDAVADSVPMLQEGTGMIDLEALFGTQLSRDSRPSHGDYPVPPAPIPTGSILMVPLPVPNARPATQTSLLRVATGSADGVPYPVRRTLNTAAVRRPRTIATVVITALAVVALAAIVYVMAARGGKATPAASVAGSGSSAALPTVTHIDEPKLTPVVAKPVAPAPAPAPAQPPPVSAMPAAPVPKLADKPKAEPVKATTAPAVVPPPPKPAAKPDKKKDACSDPLDCQY